MTVKITEKIRHKLITILKKCENERVKNFVINNVLNNTAIKNNLDSIIEKLEDRFGLSDKIKHKIAIEDFHNFKYSGSTSDIIDKIDVLRRRLNNTVTKDTEFESLEAGVFDKILLTDFLKNMKSLGRFHNDEYRKLESDFVTNKYNWDKCKK